VCRATGLNGIDTAARIAAESHEVAVLERGRSNPQIAAQLGLSRKTTSNYVSAILTKLQVRDRAEAAERARNDHR
jgi:DNA-binding NarL/FixJ family response regulator